MDQWLQDMPKADPHVHIEGAVLPDMVRAKAAAHGLTLAEGLFTSDGQSYVYNGFADLVTRVYDAVAGTIRTKEDFADAVYDHLKRGAAENCIYTGFIVSPDHCERLGLSYADMLAGMTDGINAARADFNVEARMRAVLVRHLSDTEVMRSARAIIDNPHPYVRKVDLAGAETNGDFIRFVPFLTMILNESAGHIDGFDTHESEVGGAQNLREALHHLPRKVMKSVGHGVQVMKDPALVKECRRRGLVFEVSLTSNVLAGIFPDYQSHALPEMLKAGLAVTLATDDPGLFGDCTIGGEYRIAKDEYKLSAAQLLDCTRNGIKIGGLDMPTKRRLLKRVDDFAVRAGQRSR